MIVINSSTGEIKDIPESAIEGWGFALARVIFAIMVFFAVALPLIVTMDMKSDSIKVRSERGI